MKMVGYQMIGKGTRISPDDHKAVSLLVRDGTVDTSKSYQQMTADEMSSIESAYEHLMTELVRKTDPTVLTTQTATPAATPMASHFQLLGQDQVGVINPLCYSSAGMTVPLSTQKVANKQSVNSSGASSLVRPAVSYNDEPSSNGIGNYLIPLKNFAMSNIHNIQPGRHIQPTALVTPTLFKPMTLASTKYLQPHPTTSAFKSISQTISPKANYNTIETQYNNIPHLSPLHIISQNKSVSSLLQQSVPAQKDTGYVQAGDVDAISSSADGTSNNITNAIYTGVGDVVESSYEDLLNIDWKLGENDYASTASPVSSLTSFDQNLEDRVSAEMSRIEELSSVESVIDSLTIGSPTTSETDAASRNTPALSRVASAPALTSLASGSGSMQKKRKMSTPSTQSSSKGRSRQASVSSVASSDSIDVISSTNNKGHEIPINHSFTSPNNVLKVPDMASINQILTHTNSTASLGKATNATITAFPKMQNIDLSLSKPTKFDHQQYFLQTEQLHKLLNLQQPVQISSTFDHGETSPTSESILKRNSCGNKTEALGTTSTSTMNQQKIEIKEERDAKGIRLEEEFELSPEELARWDRFRKERNRLAARKCRKKQKDRIGSLEVDVAEIMTKNQVVSDEIAQLRKEVDTLKFFLNNHNCKLTHK